MLFSARGLAEDSTQSEEPTYRIARKITNPNRRISTLAFDNLHSASTKRCVYGNISTRHFLDNSFFSCTTFLVDKSPTNFASRVCYLTCHTVMRINLSPLLKPDGLVNFTWSSSFSSSAACNCLRSALYSRPISSFSAISASPDCRDSVSCALTFAVFGNVRKNG